MRTKLFALVSALFLSAQLFAYDFVIDGIYYNFLGGDSVTVVSLGNYNDDYYEGGTTGNQYTGSITIPPTVDFESSTYRVTAIGEYAFNGCIDLTSVNIPESITYIGFGAFAGCTSLTELTIPTNVHTIDVYAFLNCTSLTELTIPANVHTIGIYAFANLSNLKTVKWNAINCVGSVDRYGDAVPLFPITDSYYYYNNQTITSFTFGDGVKTIPAGICCNLTNLTNVAIPTSVTKIGAQAFYSSGLTELVVPLNVDTVDANAFANLTQLTSVTWNAIDCYIRGYDYNYYSTNSVFGTQSESTSAANGEVPNALITTFTFGNGVKTIPNRLCMNLTALTNIVFPTSVTTIGEYAFYNCAKITELTIPANVNSVGHYAFRYMNSLNSVTWNATNCNSNNDYYSPMFEIRGEDEYSYPDSNPYITSVTFGSNVEAIPAGICNGLVNLKNITLPTALKTIGHNAFSDCESLENIIFPRAVKTIGYGAFSGCKMITTIDIPNSVTTIDGEAFAWCSSLTSAVLGEGIETIGTYAFYGCNQMTKFICNSPTAVEESYEYDFDDGITSLPCILSNTNLDTIIAPANIFDRPESVWSILAKNVRYIKVNAGELTPDAFGVINRSYKTLQHLDLAATSNTDIADEAFKGCYSLQQLQLPTQLENIGYMAFAECKSLKAIEIPSRVVSIGNSAFEDCRSIASITFESNTALQNIGSWAFYNCHELKQLAIPEGVTEVGAAAFYGCVYLEELTLPSTVQSIGDNCFAFCSKLNKITSNAIIPPSIDAKTFYEVKRSTPLYVPANSLAAYEDDIYWSEFFNILAPGETTDISSITSNNTISTNKKVFENGTIYIIRNGEKYTIDGRKVN